MHSFIISTSAVLSLAAFASAQSFVANGNGCPSDAANINAADDTVSVGFNLGFTFPYQGGLGSTTVIDIAPNGYIYFESGTNTASRCCSGASGGVPNANFLSATPSFAAFGHDLNASTTSASGSGLICFETDNAGLATITWSEVNDFGANPVTPNSIQVQLFADGTIICDYTSTGFTSEALVGYSEGNGVTDAGGSDLSNSPSGVGGTALYEVFDPAIGEDLSVGALIWSQNAAGSYDVAYSMGSIALPVLACEPPLTLSSSTVPLAGNTLVWDVENVPASAVAGVIFIGAPTGGIPLDVIGMENCTLYSNPFTTIPTMLTPPTATASLPLAASAGGLTFETQAAVIAPGFTTLGVLTSNGGTVNVGMPLTNDECTTALPLPLGLTSGSNLNATNSATTGSCGLMGSDVWYVYTATCTGTATVSCCAAGATASYDTAIAAFDGSCTALNELVCNDDTCGLQSEVSFPVTMGQQYFIAIGGFNGAQGAFTVDVSCL